MNSAIVLLYAFTCCIAGYVSGNFFKQMGGHNWVWNIILTSCLFTGKRGGEEGGGGGGGGGEEGGSGRRVVVGRREGWGSVVIYLHKYCAF